MSLIRDPAFTNYMSSPALPRPPEVAALKLNTIYSHPYNKAYSQYGKNSLDLAVARKLASMPSMVNHRKFNTIKSLIADYRSLASWAAMYGMPERIQCAQVANTERERANLKVRAQAFKAYIWVVCQEEGGQPAVDQWVSDLIDWQLDSGYTVSWAQMLKGIKDDYELNLFLA